MIYKIANYLLFGIVNIILTIILILVLGINLNLSENNLSTYNILLINISLIIFVIYLISINITYILLKKKKEEVIEEEKILSREELLSISNKELFTINGIECSIIFEDSIPENIIKNYHILVRDINAKLVNGYTFEENKMLKSICTKLQVTNLNNIDLNNLSILNKITPEEYTLLTKIYEE